MWRGGVGGARQRGSSGAGGGGVGEGEVVEAGGCGYGQARWGGAVRAAQIPRTYARNVCMRARECKRTTRVRARVHECEQRMCTRACVYANNVYARARVYMRVTASNVCARARPCMRGRTLAIHMARAARTACEPGRAGRANTRINQVNTYARNVCMRARECKRTTCVCARVHECEQRMCTRRYIYAHAYT